MSALEELIMLSDILDASGLHTEANDLDDIIKKTAVSHSSVTQYVKALKDMLVKTEIDKTTLNFITDIIDKVYNEGEFLGYKTTPEEYYAYLYNTKEPISKAIHLLTLEDDIRKTYNELTSVQDEDTRRDLEHDLKSDIQERKDVLELIQKWQHGHRQEDRDNYELFRKTYNERAGKEVF